MASLLLDGLMIALLIATIAYAVMLDRRLRSFRQSRDEMQQLLSVFTAATAQAQSGIVALREAAQSTSGDLKAQLDRAKALRDDLAFLVDRGGSLADRLEGGVSAARAGVKAAEVRTKPAIRLAEAVARQAGGPVAQDNRREERSTQRREGSAIGAMAAEASADKTNAARDFLRALRAAR